ncbi:hypothetical protein Vadar_000360 [Vaccinium darrowii]|uniref:Uncharacterized protein n=1 Tax=Vaccinium darrowii TaxID=229202 RepID=A0ACB7WWU5_9ERIC|nr:hypothetical protein Vadar_000360 [Vaccinium darrowii]
MERSEHSRHLSQAYWHIKRDTRRYQAQLPIRLPMDVAVIDGEDCCHESTALKSNYEGYICSRNSMKKILGVSSSSKSTCKSKNMVHETDQLWRLHFLENTETDYVGANAFGQLGDGTEKGRKQPKKVKQLQTEFVISVSCGAHCTAAISGPREKNGNEMIRRLWVWGQNQGSNNSRL